MGGKVYNCKVAVEQELQVCASWRFFDRLLSKSEAKNLYTSDELICGLSEALTVVF